MTILRWAPLALALLTAPAAAGSPDGETPQSAVDAAYAIISGPNGTIDSARFAHVFTPTVRFVRVRADDRGHADIVSIDAAGFTAAFTDAVKGKPFYETGRTVHADIQHAIATIISDYESKSAPGGPPFERGRNTFELVRGERGWQIDSVFWEVR